MTDLPVEDLTPAALQERLIEFMGCLRDAFDDICVVSLLFGESYFPVVPDEDGECGDLEDGEEVCSQLWVRVTGINVSNGGVEGWGEEDCAFIENIGLEVGVSRCISIPEGGEAITATDAAVAAMQSFDDMHRISCAVRTCDAWDKVTLGNWDPQGPLGGVYGGVWTMEVEL